MKISRTKITASSVDKRLSFTSTKYKGYRISLDHKNNCYNIYDKHGELEDSGFTSQLAAKEAVDKLVEASEVKSSKKIVKYPKKITAGSMPYVKWVKKAEDGSWVMWGGSNSPDIDPDFLDRINHPNFPNPEYNVENQYTDYTVLPAGQSPEDVNSSKKVTASIMYEDMDGSMAGEVGEYLSLEDLVDMYDDLKDYDPIVEQYDSFESWLRDTVNNGYLREVYSSNKITAVEASSAIEGSLLEYRCMDNEVADKGSVISHRDLFKLWKKRNSLPKNDPEYVPYNTVNAWLSDLIQQGSLVESSTCVNCDEDIEYLDNQDTLKELIDELASSGVDIYDAQEILQALGADYGYDRDDQFAILEDIQEYVGQGINSAEEIDDELETTEQEFTSKDTSINSSKLPAIYKFVNFPKGSVVLDFGGGKFDNGVEYLQSLGCEGYVYDPYNRTAEHNAEVVKAIRANGGADIVLNSNVLNVIKEAAARRTVLKNIKKLVKPNGKVYITVYEGTSKNRNKPGPTPKGYQLNQLTRDYLDEIREVFPDADLQKGNSKLIVATPNGAPVKSSINASEDVEIDYDKLEEIANRYNTSKPISGDWYKETEHELRAIASELGLSINQAKQVMIEELGFEEDQFADIPINSSEDSLTSRIFDFLDDCGGYTDYNQKVEDVSEEFGMSPDEAEGYVSSWAQGLDAMWHDTSDQYEDQDIEESCKVEASLAPFQARELVKEIQDELYNKASEVMQRPEFGFPLEEIADYLVVEVEYQPEVRTQKRFEDHPPRIKCEVRAELSFDALMELADELNPIVEKYSEWAYFDAVTSGIIDAYIELDQIKASTSSTKQPVTAGYFDPPEPAEPDTVIVPIEFDNVITLEDYDIASFSEDELFDDAYTDEYDGLSLDDEQGVEEKIGDLVINQLPDEPGNYRISGIANLAYQVSNIFMEHEPPADPDDVIGSSWWNTTYAEITYDPRSSYIESLQVEKI